MAEQAIEKSSSEAETKKKKDDLTDPEFFSCVLQPSPADSDADYIGIRRLLLIARLNLVFFDASLHPGLKSPGDWWDSFGDECPELKRFAIRVLSLTCSSSGCERNWSAFEMVDSKRRNRLHQKRMNGLVFVMYNLKLRQRHKNRQAIMNPLCLDDVPSDDEWITERERPTLPREGNWLSVLDRNARHGCHSEDEEVDALARDLEQACRDWRCNGKGYGNLLVDASVGDGYHLQVHSLFLLRWTAGVLSGDLRSGSQALSHSPSFSSKASNASDGDHPRRKAEPGYSYVGMHCIFDQCKAMVTVVKFGQMSSDLLAYGASDGTLTVCTVSDPPAVLNQLIGHSKDVTVVNNNFLSVGNANKEITVFNFSTGRVINKTVFDNEVTAMDHDHTGLLIFCGDAQGCIVGSEDANVYFYYLTRPRHACVNKLQGHGYPIIGIAWNHGENLLASSDLGGTVIIWKTAKTG
ncbi:unnamed protein product [Camellia sinensis]